MGPQTRRPKNILTLTAQHQLQPCPSHDAYTSIDLVREGSVTRSQPEGSVVPITPGLLARQHRARASACLATRDRTSGERLANARSQIKRIVFAFLSGLAISSLSDLGRPSGDSFASALINTDISSAVHDIGRINASVTVARLSNSPPRLQMAKKFKMNSWSGKI